MVAVGKNPAPLLRDTTESHNGTGPGPSQNGEIVTTRCLGRQKSRAGNVGLVRQPICKSVADRPIQLHKERPSPWQGNEYE